MQELCRVVRPGGYLVISLHGEHYLNDLTPTQQQSFRAGHLVVNQETRVGENICSAVHPYRYVADVLAHGNSITGFIPEGAHGNPLQDLYIIQVGAAS
jgi:hypothetical protein